MPDIPQAAVAAAAAAISDEYRSNDGNPRERFSRDLAILAIEAAAPHIAAVERERITDMADRLAATVPVQGGTMAFSEVVRHTTTREGTDDNRSDTRPARQHVPPRPNA